MSKQKIRFIINPISGTKHKDQLPSQIEAHLDHTRFDYEIFVSQYAGHAAILAKDAVNQHVDILAVAGGDGSINEVGTPLIGTDLALAVIPCGSGNGLSRCLDLPLDPVKSELQSATRARSTPSTSTARLSSASRARATTPRLPKTTAKTRAGGSIPISNTSCATTSP